MKFLLISYGSLGDLAPLIPLAKALQERGHAVSVMANCEISSIAEPHGISYHAIQVSAKQILTSESGAKLLQAGSPAKSLKIMASFIRRQLFSIGCQLYEVAKDMDVLVINERYFLLAQSIGEKLNIPIVQVCYQPKGITKKYAYPYFSTWYFSFLTNAMTHRFVESALIRFFLPPVNRFRKKILGLPSISRRRVFQQKINTPIIQGYSRHVFKPPLDWPSHSKVVGYWSLASSTWQPSHGLINFLSDSANTKLPIVYIGFGSMLYNPIKLRDVLLELVSILNIRILWSLNWSETDEILQGELTPGIYVINEGPHDALFPLVDCVVHHGGAGTTAAAFRCGKPQLISWFMLDQQFWASHVASILGGLNLGKFNSLTTNALAKAISKILNNPTYSQQAKQISRSMATENGASIACDYLESLFDHETGSMV